MNTTTSNAKKKQIWWLEKYSDIDKVRRPSKYGTITCNEDGSCYFTKSTKKEIKKYHKDVMEAAFKTQLNPIFRESIMKQFSRT